VCLEIVLARRVLGCPALIALVDLIIRARAQGGNIDESKREAHDEEEDGGGEDDLSNA